MFLGDTPTRLKVTIARLVSTPASVLRLYSRIPGTDRIVIGMAAMVREYVHGRLLALGPSEVHVIRSHVLLIGALERSSVTRIVPVCFMYAVACQRLIPVPWKGDSISMRT